MFFNKINNVFLTRKRILIYFIFFISVIKINNNTIFKNNLINIRIFYYIINNKDKVIRESIFNYLI